MDNNNQPVVIDNGSEYIRAGFSSDDAPRAFFQNVYGQYRRPSVMIGFEQKDYYIGNEALERKGILNLEYPVKRGIVQDWDKMVKIWNHIYFQHLKTQPEEQPCFITDTCLNPSKNREKMFETMFETFRVPKMAVASQSTLALYSSGRTSGLIVHFGSGYTITIPIIEGYQISPSVNRLDFGGIDITERLMTMSQRFYLERHPQKPISSINFEICKEIKEKCCYVFTGEKKQQTFTMPDGNKIQIKDEAWQAPEVLFDPSLIGMECNSTQENVLQSIEKCDIAQRPLLKNNILLSGGTSYLEGLDTRLVSEMVKLNQDKQNIKVIVPPDRKLDVWIGASILSSLNSFHQNMWITKKEFQEYGESMLHRIQN